MAQPTPYSRQYNFTNYQAVQPSVPLPAAQVDLELNSVKATVDQILNNLKLIQRDDTALANLSVGKDQLKAEVLIGINPPVVWMTGYAFIVGDTTVVGAIFYRCLVSHTSGVFATDLAAAKWSVLADFNSVVVDIPGAIHNATEKTAPADLDELAITDSAASYVLKKVTWTSFKASAFAAWGALIGTATAKATPVGADLVAVADSTASNATKSVSLTALWAATFGALGPLLAAATTKATPVDADGVFITDSAAAGASKKLTWANLKTVVFAALGPLIAAATVKSTPIDADGLLITDSAAAGINKFLSWVNLKTGVFTALGPLIAAATAKTTPIDADGVLITDSAAAGVNKFLNFTNLKAFLKTYFDTLYSNSSMTLLGTLTTTSGTTQSLTGLSGYKELYCEIEDVSFTTAVVMTLALSSTNGATYDTARTVTAALGLASDTFKGYIRISLVASLVQTMKVFNSNVQISSGASGLITPIVRTISTDTAAACNAIQFAGGTFDAGTIRVYGVK